MPTLKDLTTHQRNFLLEYFFKNEKYAGWRNIANNLLNIGTCIVPGKECIWVGHIGNFITTKPAANAVDCIEYSFDLVYFLNSAWYRDIRKQYVAILTDEITNKAF